MKYPGKDLPRAMIFSTGFVTIIAFIGIVAAGVLPIDQVAGQSLSLVAQTIFPKPFYIFYIVGAIPILTGLRLFLV